MRKGFFILAVFTSFQCSAQNVVFKKGQQIIINTTISQSTDMMGMSMKNNSASTHKIIVKDESANRYVVENTLTKLVVDSDNPMQPIHYDSDKKQDSDSAINNALGSEINIPHLFFVDKKTSAITAEKQASEDSTSKDEKKDLMSMMGNLSGDANIATISSTFFLIPAGKNQGDSWADSSTIDKIKSVNKYSIQSIDKNTITISLNGIMSGNTTMEIQGNQLDIDLNTTTTGTIVMDKLTSLVKSRVTNTAVNSNIMAMGQSLPVNGTVTTTTTFE
ncbi:MAG: hypothetical protein JSU03_05165 [Bacteroidetes bacterium]|nr:hypothetical protein [Bacteroidota bacterium]MBS1756647.1 hypothetical protein [Bacteroidota bacterium]